MCLIILGWNVHPSYSLIVASNRDEFYERPTEQINWWSDHPNILAGRDKAQVLGQSGTWMGITKSGRFCALTNVRSPNDKNANLKTRGELTSKFLRSSVDIENFIQENSINFDQYNGFNLLMGDLKSNQLSWTSNRKLNGIKISPKKSYKPNFLNPGIYGLSNAMLDTPWPKVEKSKFGFSEALRIDDGEFNEPDCYFKVLLDNQIAEDNKLPTTGVSYEWEKILSSPFIKTENYGTRSSSLLRIKKNGEFEFTEQIFDAQGTVKSKSVRSKII